MGIVECFCLTTDKSCSDILFNIASGSFGSTSPGAGSSLLRPPAFAMRSSSSFIFLVALGSFSLIKVSWPVSTCFASARVLTSVREDLCRRKVASHAKSEFGNQTEDISRLFSRPCDIVLSYHSSCTSSVRSASKSKSLSLLLLQGH